MNNRNNPILSFPLTEMQHHGVIKIDAKRRVKLYTEVVITARKGLLRQGALEQYNQAMK